MRRPAAVARTREQVRLRELVQDSTFSAKYDPFLVYPLGEAFVAGLVRRYGTEAPGQVVRAFARPNALKDLTGLELWQDVMQSCGFNLGEVENAFLNELDDATRAEEVFVGSLPRLRGAISHQEGKIRIRATYLGSPGGQVLCRFRAREDTLSTELLHATRIGSDSFEVDTAFLSERTFYYQLGWDSPKSSQPIYEPWMSAPVR